MAKSKRKRVSREDVRRNAQKSGDRRDFFRLPKGVALWEPEKAGQHLIDIVPYETKSASHPDNIEPGMVWYKHPFQVHKNVGPNNIEVVCPGSIGKRCPICEERAKLTKNWDENAEQIKALNFQNWVAYNILNPDDKDGVMVFAYSFGKFAKPLQKELDEGAEDILHFYDVTDEGRTLKVRFSDATFEGRKYLEATRIDFQARPEMDEDEVLGRTVCLEECFNILAYDKLKALFLQLDPDETTGDKGKKPKAEEPAEEPVDEEPEADPADEPAEPEEPADEEPDDIKKGDAVIWEDNGEDCTGTVVRLNDAGTKALVLNDESGGKEWVNVDALSTAEDADPDEPEEPAEPEEPEEPADDEPKKPGKKGDPVYKKGETISWVDGKKTRTGKVTGVDGTNLTVKDDDGDEYDVEVGEVIPFDAKADAKKPGKAEEKPAAKKGDGKKGDVKCPAGGTFGKDVDKFGKKCDACPHWDACEAAHG